MELDPSLADILRAVNFFNKVSKVQGCGSKWDQNREINRVFRVMSDNGYCRLTFARGMFHGIKDHFFYIFSSLGIQIFDDENKFLTTFHYKYIPIADPR